MRRRKYIRTVEHMNNWRVSRLGHPVTKETREKLRKASIKQWKRQHAEGFVSEKKNKTLEEMYGIEGAKLHRTKLRDGHKKNPHVGWHHTPEAKEKNRIAHLGKPTGRKGSLEILYGKEKASEIRKKLILSHLGKIQTKESNLKRSKTLTENMETKSIGKFYKRGYYDSEKNGKVWYRSGWELQVMKSFDKKDMEWIYETKVNRFFLKSINRYYMNDFYLPKENKYVQVKGRITPDDKFFVFQKEYSDLNSEMWDSKILKDKGIL